MSKCSVIVCTSNPHVPPRWRPRPDLLNMMIFEKSQHYFVVHVFEIQVLRKLKKNRYGGFCALLACTTRKKRQYTCRKILFKPRLCSGDLKKNISVENSAQIFLRSQYFLYKWYGWESNWKKCRVYVLLTKHERRRDSCSYRLHFCCTEWPTVLYVLYCI